MEQQEKESKQVMLAHLANLSSELKDLDGLVTIPIRMEKTPCEKHGEHIRHTPTSVVAMCTNPMIAVIETFHSSLKMAMDLGYLQESKVGKLLDSFYKALTEDALAQMPDVYLPMLIAAGLSGILDEE